MNQVSLRTKHIICLLFCLLLFCLLLFLSAAAQADTEIQLNDGSALTITETRYNRMLPHSFYDQAMASLPQLYPEHELLAGRRSGRVGGVIYSLICYRKSPSSDRVIIQAVAVHNRQAWNIETLTNTTSYPGVLLQVLERINGLPSITH
jgi:hypothetical protein